LHFDKKGLRSGYFIHVSYGPFAERHCIRGADFRKSASRVELEFQLWCTEPNSNSSQKTREEVCQKLLTLLNKPDFPLADKVLRRPDLLLFFFEEQETISGDRAVPVSVATVCKLTIRTVCELGIKTRNSSSSSYFQKLANSSTRKLFEHTSSLHVKSKTNFALNRH
jgi:hypothetical protein